MMVLNCEGMPEDRQGRKVRHELRRSGSKEMESLGGRYMVMTKLWGKNERWLDECYPGLKIVVLPPCLRWPCTGVVPRSVTRERDDLMIFKVSMYALHPESPIISLTPIAMKFTTRCTAHTVYQISNYAFSVKSIHRINQPMNQPDPTSLTATHNQTHTYIPTHSVHQEG